MDSRSPLFPMIAVAALAIGGSSLYTTLQRRSCECPRPAIHDDRDNEPRRPLRPRRPDGSTGEVKDVSGVVNRDM